MKESWEDSWIEINNIVLIGQGSFHTLTKGETKIAQKRKEKSSATKGFINVISGRYFEFHSINDSVHTLMKTIKTTTKPLIALEMIFNEMMESPIQYPHADPVVLTLKVGQMNVRRVLVDASTTADLVTMDCLQQLKYEA